MLHITTLCMECPVGQKRCAAVLLWLVESQKMLPTLTHALSLFSNNANEVDFFPIQVGGIPAKCRVRTPDGGNSGRSSLPSVRVELL